MKFNAKWQASKASEEAFFPATVPGSVHYDLMAAGRLKNFFASSQNAFDALWVQQSDWLFKTVFSKKEITIDSREFVLRFNGIDTFSEIRLNGRLLGETKNAYKRYEFVITKDELRDLNELTVLVKAHGKMIEHMRGYAKRLQVGDQVEGSFGKALIRRYQRSFFGGSSLLNLGTGVLGIGIYRDIEMDYNIIKDYQFSVLDCNETKAVCRFSAKANAEAVRFTLFDGEKVAYEGAGGTVVIEKPRLWWPNGYGKANQYTLVITAGKHKVITKVGIKKVELIEKSGNQDDFYFKINGRKLYIHGQNHIPLDYIKVYGEERDYDNLFTLMKHQNVNMVRIWGGGVVENPSFYDRLDENGILLWHELFLHSNVYPDFDEAWVKDFAEEAKGILDQIKNRACLALLCGGNEQYEGWDEWGWKNHMEYFFGERLVTEIIPKIRNAKCPQIPYIVNSPHGGRTCQSPASGESHIWGNFYNSFKDPLFVTETCWTQESYSRPETLKKYMDLNVADYEAPGWAKQWEELTGRPFFKRMPFTNWFAPETLASYLHGLELEQMRADYHALSNFRYNSPSNNGVIYWAMNKGGPLFQFSCVDYGGYPMMAFYAVKKAFTPLGAYPYRDGADLCAVASNHTKDTAEVTVNAYFYGEDGIQKKTWTRRETLASGELKRMLRLENLYTEVTARGKQAFYVTISKDGDVVSDDMLLFVPFGEYEITGNPLDIKCQMADNGYKLFVSSQTPVHMVEIECSQKAVCSDNYFPITQDHRKEIFVKVLEETHEPVKFFINPLGGLKRELTAD